jgi:hypothetical protein
MILTSKWFAPIFALLQLARHLGMIAYDYWFAATHLQSFDPAQYLRNDLARPLFESSEVCRMIVDRFPSASQAVLGLDFPAYAITGVLHSALSGQLSCEDTLLSPRGQILSAAFVLPIWFLVGLSIRRLAHRRWRRRAESRTSHVMTVLHFISISIGFLAVFASLCFLPIDIWAALEVAGVAFWCLYFSVLAAERLRLGRFRLVSDEI